jgi:hypothetical protein
VPSCPIFVKISLRVLPDRHQHAFPLLCCIPSLFLSLPPSYFIFYPYFSYFREYHFPETFFQLQTVADRFFAKFHTSLSWSCFSTTSLPPVILLYLLFPNIVSCRRIEYFLLSNSVSPLFSLSLHVGAVSNGCVVRLVRHLTCVVLCWGILLQARRFPHQDNCKQIPQQLPFPAMQESCQGDMCVTWYAA